MSSVERYINFSHSRDSEIVTITVVVLQVVQSEFRVGSFAVVQQLQLQVDGTNDRLSCEAAEP